MNAFIQIHTDQPTSYYSLFYLIAFASGFVLLVWEGHRRQFPVTSWLMVIGTAFLFFMAGCRLLFFSSAEWQHVLRMEPLTHSPGLSVLGGIAFSVPAILLARKLLGFRLDMMDAFALLLPVGLMIERFGCLLAGCCYGTPTDLPWAIQYTNLSHAFSQHAHLGWIRPDSLTSLPVHPVQVYEVLACLGIILTLGWLRKHVKAAGNLFLISLVLYGAARFLLEFVRSAEGRPFHGVFAGINIVQWSILGVCSLLVAVIVWKERHPQQAETSETLSPSITRYAFYFLSLTTLCLLVSQWLSPVEITSLSLVMLPLLATIGWRLFMRVTLPGFRLTSVTLSVLAVLLTNQTLPEFSKNDSTLLRYTTIRVGALTGSNTLNYNTSDCNGGTNKIEFDHTYSAMAVGIGQTVQQKREYFISYGMDGFTGSHQVSGSNTPTVGQSVHLQQNFSYFGIRPYAQFDWKYVGFGIGFNAGNFATINPANEANPVNKLDIFPSLSIRAGKMTGVFFDGRLGNQFPASFPGTFYQLAIGFGSKKGDGSAFRMGTGAFTSLFFAGTIPAGKHVLIEPAFGFGPGLISSPIISSEYSGEGLMGSISLHYKFNRKEVPVARLH